jgi:hypothetical protein
VCCNEEEEDVFYLQNEKLYFEFFELILFPLTFHCRSLISLFAAGRNFTPTLMLLDISFLFADKHFFTGWVEFSEWAETVVADPAEQVDFS